MRLEVVSEAAVVELDARIDVSRAVRDALVAAARREAVSFPVLRAHGAQPSQGINVKFGVSFGGLVGGKVGTYWPGNAAQGLPNHAAATLLLDPETGFPRALVAARTLNRRRTAAADALAVDALARPDACRLAIVGAGGQAPWEARAIAAVRPLREIRLVARRRAAAETLAATLCSLAPTQVFDTIAEAVRGADIVVTATPSTSPLLAAADLSPGTHVSAMGADARGKRELDLGEAPLALFADLPAQAAEIGELQHLSPARQAQATALGAVLAGQHTGRADPAQITLFDSSGLAAQDLFAAEAALAAARAAGLCQTVDF